MFAPESHNQRERFVTVPVWLQYCDVAHVKLCLSCIVSVVCPTYAVTPPVVRLLLVAHCVVVCAFGLPFLKCFRHCCGITFDVMLSGRL